MKENLKKGLFMAVTYVILKCASIGLIGTYLYKNGMWSNWFLVIIPVIGSTVFFFWKKEFKFIPFFKKAIEKHFPRESSEVLTEVNEHFKKLSLDTKFAARSSNPIDRRLDFSAYFLALIKTLENRNHSYEQIKEMCLEITYDYVTPKNALQRFLRRLPPKLIGLKITKPFIKLLHNKFIIKGNPDGFRAGIVTDKIQTYDLGYGIDIFECGICKLFQKHDAGKYASILCEVDKLTSSLAGLELIRNSTIAYGAEKCDFRFKRISRGHSER
jgi:hypothetical protein